MNEKVKNVVDEIINLINLKKFSISEKKINKLLFQYPNLDIAHNLKGLILENKKMYNDAIKSFKKAILINPKFISAIINLAKTEEKVGEINDALISYKKALSIKPESEDINNAIGLLLIEEDKLESALTYISKAEKLNSANFRTYYNFGKLYEKNDFYEFYI